MLLLLDASVIYAGLVGPADGPSATLLATIRLGGFRACTTDNSMEETRRRLLSRNNASRLKVSFTQTDRDMKALREAPTFTIHPWVNAAPDLFPDDPNDAYLLTAMTAYRPSFLLTWDKALLNLKIYEGVVVTTPSVFLAALDAIDGP